MDNNILVYEHATCMTSRPGPRQQRRRHGRRPPFRSMQPQSRSRRIRPEHVAPPIGMLPTGEISHNLQSYTERKWTSFQSSKQAQEGQAKPRRVANWHVADRLLLFPPRSLSKAFHQFEGAILRQHAGLLLPPVPFSGVGAAP